MPPPPGQSASPAYRILQGETISVIVWSNVAVTLASSWRVVYDDGSEDRISTDAFTTGSLRAAQYMLANQVARLDGYVTEGVVLFEGTGPTQRGQTYVQALVIMNPDTPTTTRQVIAASYIYAGHAPTLGEIVEPGPAGGPGQLSTITGTTPAAGAEASDTVPVGAIWRIRAWRALFTAAVVAATRIPRIVIDDNGAADRYLAFSGAYTNITTGQVVPLVWCQGVLPSSGTAIQTTLDTALTSLRDSLPAPGVLVGNASRIRTLTTAIDPGDTYTLIRIVVEEWVMPN